MCNQSNFKITTLFLILFTTVSIPVAVFSQVKYRAQFSETVISGTSTLHDWESKSSEGKLEALFVLDNDKLITVSALNFIIPSQSLKSGHNLMDKNTYKALNTDSYSNISFVLSSVTVVPKEASTFLLKCVGKLTIAGTAKETDLWVTCKWNAADKSFSCSGTKKLKMTEYKVKPPVVILGTIKTGDEITISYNLKISKE